MVKHRLSLSGLDRSNDEEYNRRFFEITHCVTACSTVILEKLIGSQLVKKFLAFYGTRRFITAFTSSCHLSLS